ETDRVSGTRSRERGGHNSSTDRALRPGLLRRTAVPHGSAREQEEEPFPRCFVWRMSSVDGIAQPTRHELAVGELGRRGRHERRLPPPAHIGITVPFADLSAPAARLRIRPCSASSLCSVSATLSMNLSTSTSSNSGKFRLPRFKPHE